MSTRRVCVIRNGKQDFIMAKAGRKLKTNALRHKCGKPVQPTPTQRERDVRSVAASNPERRPYGDMAQSQLAGYPLGRMIMQKTMTRQQVAVIERAGNIIGRFLLSIPDAKPNGKGPSWARFTKDDLGTEYAPQDRPDSAPETDEERDARSRHAFEELQRDLMDGGFVTQQVLITRVHLRLQDVHDHEVGDLRLMANHLSRLWKARREI
jgi:ribosomal protein L34E